MNCVIFNVHTCLQFHRRIAFIDACCTPSSTMQWVLLLLHVESATVGLLWRIRSHRFRCTILSPQCSFLMSRPMAASSLVSGSLEADTVVPQVVWLTIDVRRCVWFLVVRVCSTNDACWPSKRKRRLREIVFIPRSKQCDF